MVLLDIDHFDLNKCDGDGQTPLMIATKLAKNDICYSEIVRTLLMEGADPKIKDFNGLAPLDEAISQVMIKISFIIIFFFISVKC